jgi:hypothetical protein
VEWTAEGGKRETENGEVLASVARFRAPPCWQPVRMPARMPVMPAIFDNQSIRFQYPENWSLDESEVSENTVTVYSPGGAFWSLVWRDLSEDPHELAVEALQALKKEYPETESEPANDVIGGGELSGFDVSFYYLDLINTALIRAFRTPTASCLLLCQAEDREFRELEPIFQAMTASILE